MILGRAALRALVITIWSLPAVLPVCAGTLLPGPSSSTVADQVRALPIADGWTLPTDWLLEDRLAKARLLRSPDGRTIYLDNGLIRRSLRVVPNLATIGLALRQSGRELLRAVAPEATLVCNGQRYPVGGLTGQPEKAYLLEEWLDRMKPLPLSFTLSGFRTLPLQESLSWKKVRRAGDSLWPPAGLQVEFEFAPPPGVGLEGVRLTVHYALYDGLPLLAKWLTLENRTSAELLLEEFESELLAPAEVESAVDPRDLHEWRLPPLLVFSDYTFHGMDLETANQTTAWVEDPEYTSQVNYEKRMPARVVSRPPVGPRLRIPSGEEFRSYRTWVLVHDSEDRERQGLSIRRVYRTLAPWATENPLMMHVRRSERASFRLAVDQCAEVGFEMIIYTFGSGLDMENLDPGYLSRVREDVEYAHSKGIEVGAYSLLASRRISDDVDVVNPATGQTGGAIFGHSPCLATDWGNEYFRKIRAFIESTGLDLLEHDGSYPGDLCASTTHSGHAGLQDSQWRQWEKVTELYRWCRSRGVFLNVPDHYFLNGTSKTGMGYRETNWSLPRERQILLGRQNIYDGTWTKTPAMGWMFVPLTEYHGGGAAATLEPLKDHLGAYEAHLVNNLSAGVQACYRGPRLYDSPETRDLVKGWVEWFKRYRPILESDVIHLRRPNGRDWDGFLHVNPRLKHRALAVLFNPLPQPLQRKIDLPLYYTGLGREALIRQAEGQLVRYDLDCQGRAEVELEIPARSFTWLVVEEP